ncbi:hypothetical protein [Haliangium sp.]|uniref:hypothetical protein n=1 Tax=Haliangium sp. TaxID=2663208 RepID=UPI003D123AAA
MSKRSAGDELIIRRAHLDRHRRSIIARSLASAMAGAVPIPLVDEWLSATVQRGTLRRLAADYRIDLDDAALGSLVHGRLDEADVPGMALDLAIMRVLTTTWRKLVIALVTARGVRTTARMFTRATLFDHYCAKLHVGLGLDGPGGLEVRRIIDQAMDETPGGVGLHVFRRALVAAARATVRAPAELIDLATAGTLRRLLAARRAARRGDELELAAAEEVDTALERQLADEQGFLARATRAVEIQLSVQGNPYLDKLIDNFERLWRDRPES